MTPATPKFSSFASNLGRAIAFYYAVFFAFAFLAGQSFFASLGPKPTIALALFTAWLGAIVGIALVFIASRNAADAFIYRSILGGVLLDLACNFWVAKMAPSSNLASEVLRFCLAATGNLGVLAAATGAGLLVARGLQKPNYLVMAAVVGALTDIFSVYAGPSKHVVNSQAFLYFSYQWGVVGEGVVSCIGAGDFIFLSLYFAGARRFRLDERKTLIAMIAAFGLGFISLLISPAGIPALPFMAALLLLVHGRELKMQMKSDKLIPRYND